MTNKDCVPFPNPELTAAAAAEFLMKMLLIRRAELKVEELYHLEQMKTPVHLSLGQEAVSAGVCMHLNRDDVIFSNHRSHGHYLAKGGSLKELIAELYCRETGCSKGRGGSMHVIAKDAGHWGSSSIVAGATPHAVGAALAFRMQKKNAVSVCFLGDGACEQGVFFESMNWAALKKVPVVFVIENNFYSVSSHISVREANEFLYKRARAFDIPSFRADGMNPLDVYASAAEAVEHARSGKGPFVVEYVLQRWRMHVGPGDPNAALYRAPEELQNGYQRDPIKEFVEHVLKTGILKEQEISQISSRVDGEVEEAFAFAQNSPLPDGKDLAKFLFVE